MPSGHGCRRALLAWTLALLAGLAGVPGVAAQEPPPAHQVTVIAASMSLDQEPSIETMFANDAVEHYGGDACSGDPAFTIDPATRNATFEEGVTAADCAEAQLAVRVPEGATSLTVAFVANRRIVQFEQQPQAPLQHNMVQEFRVYGPEGRLAEFAYHDIQAGNSPPLPYRFEAQVPPGVRQVTLGWFFEDQGATTQAGVPLTYGQSFRASVTNLSLEWPSIPLDEPSIAIGPEDEHEDEGIAVAHTYVNVTLPDLAPLVVGRTSGLHLTIAAGPELVGLKGPAGDIDPLNLERTEGSRRVEMSLNETFVAQQGFGTYSFDFLTARALAPVPPPTPPTRLYQLFWTLLLLPIPAAVLATYSANAYRREAEGPYLRTARAVLAGIVAVVVYYVIIGLYALIAIGPRTMATIPPTNVVLLLYAQLLVILFLLVAIAILQGRSRTGAMRRDIEERRRKEDRLRRSNEELERFAYVASHDLQEPLRKVAGFTALLQKRYAGRLDKDADEIIQYAVDGATRMQMLIKDILAYSRVGSKELNRVPVDANQVMQQVVEDLEAPIRETGAEVRWEQLPTVRADASQLRQVLQNLVENAIKYRHPKRRPKVEVTASSDPKAWHFAVQDNGQGIPEDKHEEIFGIFRRLHGQSTPGTGIGLAVAKKALERHDGRIWVESKPGKGSTFHFTLPRSLLDGSGPWVKSTPAPEGASAGGTAA
jgi:signal transduction histidine kinase